MSAYVVDDEHISYLLQAACHLTRNGYHLYYGPYGHDDSIRLLPETVAEIGVALLAENIASVSYRYPDAALGYLTGPVGAIDYTYRHSIYVSLKSVDILKAIQGYEYQSCEHPGWQASKARAFCEQLRDFAIDALPGYNDSRYWAVTAETARPSRAVRIP